MWAFESRFTEEEIKAREKKKNHTTQTQSKTNQLLKCGAEVREGRWGAGSNHVLGVGVGAGLEENCHDLPPPRYRIVGLAPLPRGRCRNLSREVKECSVRTFGFAKRK